MSAIIKQQKIKLQNIIIKDLQQFFLDQKIKVVKIEPESESQVRFFRIYFDDYSIVDHDAISIDLLKFGYIGKQWRGSSPTFNLVVLVNKQL